MNMFTNYDLVPDSYVPCNIQKDTLSYQPIHKPFEQYNINGDFIGYGWSFGDSIVLEFYTCGDVYYEDQDVTENAETYLKDKTFRLELYDFRYEVVFSYDISAATVVKILIDAESSERLVKGVYHLKFTLIDEVENVLTTLIDGNDCAIYIK